MRWLVLLGGVMVVAALWRSVRAQKVDPRDVTYWYEVEPEEQEEEVVDDEFISEAEVHMRTGIELIIETLFAQHIVEPERSEKILALCAEALGDWNQVSIMASYYLPAAKKEA